MIMNNKKEFIGVILILISAIAYGLMPIFSSFAYKSGTEVSTLLFTRFFVTSILLWPYILLKKMKYKITKSHLLYLGFIGILGYSVASIAIYTAYKTISGSIATLILFSHPIFVVLIEKFIFRKKFSLKRFVSLFLIVIGLIIVLYTKNASINIMGIILSFISSISYAIYCVGLSEKRTQKLNGVIVTAYVSAFTLFTSFIQCIINNAPLLPKHNIGIINGILLAIISTIIASVTFFEGLSRIGASSATLISSVEPVIVIILSSWFLGEVLKYNVFVGGAIIIIAVILLEYKKKSLKY